MQLWPVSLQSGDAPHAAAEGLIDCIARPDFGRRALARLNCSLPVAWWTVSQVFDDQPPRLCAQGCFDAPDIALDCWRIYSRGLYRSDANFSEARRHARDNPASSAVVTHCVASDFGRAHREQIYRAHSLSERLSLVSHGVESDGSANTLLAVNLYRHRAQPRFSATEIDTVFALVGPLLAVVRRHVALGAVAPAPHAEGEVITPTAPSKWPMRLAMQRLGRHCPQLTGRELTVCERLLRGWTFEGIAADLGVSTSTAKTYRNRAFERLGIHHRNELFSLALD